MSKGKKATVYNYGDVIRLPDLRGDTSSPYTLSEKDVAVISDKDGNLVDVAWNWETSESMVLEGYVATAVGKDNRERYGRYFAAWREQYLDCWGK